MSRKASFCHSTDNRWCKLLFHPSQKTVNVGVWMYLIYVTVMVKYTATAKEHENNEKGH